MPETRKPAPTLEELRAEMARLSVLLIKKSRAYDQRERVIEQRHAAGATNYSGDLYAVKKRDIILQDLSGASKTISAILAAVAATISAEIAFRRMDWERRNPVAASMGWNGGQAGGPRAFQTMEDVRRGQRT